MTDKYQKLRQDLAAAIADAKQQGGVNERAEQIAALLAEFDALTAAQPDLTQQTLDDVMAGIPARDAEIAALRKEIDSLRAQPPVSGADGLPIELRGISEAIGNGDGVWRSCSGCHELNEGMATGPFSKTFKCHLGVGCAECGGIGAIWDTTDYDAMADLMAIEYQQRTENTEPAGQDQGDSWSGWACQYPGKLPRLYGAKDIAVANHHPEEGDRLIFLTAQQDAAQLIEPSGNSGELHASFESWRKSELPWTSPATTGMGFAWDAWRARAALAQQDADKVDAERWRTFIDNYDEYGTVGFIDGSALKAVIDAARKERA
ncbi:MAG: hypothetical protein ACN6OK_05740 [Alcaligenes faecalis]|nr:hypothetical protein [Alcaligenes faecalis]